jgi:hypothetical protein
MVLQQILPARLDFFAVQNNKKAAQPGTYPHRPKNQKHT